MSSWGKKLTTKINALNESSSKESIQTLAKWIGFNRKHAAKGFVPVLKDSIVQAKTGALQLARLSVIHEVLVLDKEDPDKWQRMEELRLLLAESVLLPLAPQLQEPAREEVRSSFLKAWDDANSFSGPTLINQIRKSVSTKSAADDSPSTTTAAASTTSPETTSPSASKHVTPSSSEAATGNEAENKLAPKDPPQASTTEVPNKTNQKGDDAGRKISATSTSPDKKKDEAPIPKEPQKATKAAPATGSATLTYDFEASGIPAEKMDPKTLLEPTKTIASLQIARDLRNDGAVQLSSLLANLPENIRQSCEDKEELTADKARDYAMRTPDVLIDMDLEEQLQSIRMYRDIVKRQRAARKQLIRALIASRCQFGAQEAAEGFENAHRARGQLLKRKQVLMDAMELEGQDCTQEEKNLYSVDATDFAPLEWYKKARTEEKS